MSICTRVAMNFVQQPSGELTALRDLHLQRIDVLVVDQNFVVQMRAGGDTGHAAIGKYLALTNPRALAHAGCEA